MSLPESAEEEPGDRTGGRLLACFGLGAVVAAVWLVAIGKNAGFAAGLALAGVFCLIVALVPDRVEELGAGNLTAKMRKKRAAGIDELSSDKALDGEVTVAEQELPAAGAFLATMRALDGLLRPSQGPLGGCVLHLYTFDERAGLLIPTYETDPASTPSNWSPGVGVTGQAYVTDSFVLATGEHTHNATHHLSEEEQTKHLDLYEVAAVPVTNAAGNTIAILAASNRVAPGILSSTDGYEEFLALAEAIARILIDLLGGFDDG